MKKPLPTSSKPAVSISDDHLHIPVTTLKGVGPAMAGRLKKLNIDSVQDLFFHLPFRYQDRTHITPMAILRPGDHAVVEGIIELTTLKSDRRRSLLCYIRDNSSGHILLRFFYFHPSLQEQLQRGIKIRCFGEVRLTKLGLEMVHPEYHIVSATTPLTKTLTPIYPATEGLSQITLRKLVGKSLQLLEKNPQILPDLLPQPLLTDFELMNLHEAILYLQQPPQDADTHRLSDMNHPAQQRLIVEELLAYQLSVFRLRTQVKEQSALSLQNEENLTELFLQQLSFQLTAAQQRVVNEIKFDLAQTKPMLRLVQGDVGSGKTVVAALAALQAIAKKTQVALMAPTELLAEQHFHNFTRWLTPLGIKVSLLTAKHPSKKRKEFLQDLANGTVQLVIGTHALFQEQVTFSRLALIIIDEQHRFGVQQRLSLRKKGFQQNLFPHQLIMTATPIPRTLAMTTYADLDCSMIDELPPGRSPVNTIAIPQERRPEVISHVLESCRSGKQVYWVCTLITESEILQCQAAEVIYQNLQQALPELKIGLVHGALKSPEKENVMQAFKNKEINLLVATTVIEVGVDVPNASLMIIENPERLGLAQLHQLRGRVGRGNTQSHCVLLYQSPLSLLAKKRLDLMRQTNDGFIIAEADLQLRGPGEVLGTRQAGVVSMKIADVCRDNFLLEKVRQIAILILEKYPSCVDLLLQRWLKNMKQYQDV